MPAKQIVVISAVIALMGGLLSLTIHKAGMSVGGGVKQSEQKTPARIDEAEFTKREKASLSPEQLDTIERLEKQASATSSLQGWMLLGTQWKAFKHPAMAGLALYDMASKHPSINSWMMAGTALKESFEGIQDSSVLNTLFSKAVVAYQNVLKLDPNNLEAKTGLGICYVTGSTNPMEGIGLLLGVVGKDPNNIPANFNLGLFSMRSGQYEKAIGRFQTVVKYAPSGEAYFYLGQAYQNLNKKEAAIDAYQNSKKYLNDPQTLGSVDQLIKQLKN